MTYKKYTEMKKESDFAFVDSGKKYLVNSSAIVDQLKNDNALSGLFGGVPVDTLCSMIKGKINTLLGLSPWCWDLNGDAFTLSSGRKYFFDFESDLVNVYNEKNGKQVYKVVNVRALRLASFRPNAYYNESADYSVIVGRWSVGSGVCSDAYIREVVA